MHQTPEFTVKYFGVTKPDREQTGQTHLNATYQQFLHSTSTQFSLSAVVVAVVEFSCKQTTEQEQFLISSSNKFSIKEPPV